MLRESEYTFFPENCAAYKIMSKNVMEPETPLITMGKRYMLD
jgi:hypothetical protein